MSFPYDWRIIDERVAGDSRSRLGRMDKSETVFCTLDGAMFGRIYPKEYLQLGCILNKRSFNVAMNHVHSLDLHYEPTAQLPRFNRAEYLRFDLGMRMDHDTQQVIPDFDWHFPE